MNYIKQMEQELKELEKNKERLLKTDLYMINYPNKTSIAERGLAKIQNDIIESYINVLELRIKIARENQGEIEK